MNETLRFRKYSWQLAPRSIKEIRRKVFLEEQKVPEELEWDDTDEIAEHILVVTAENEPCATARVFSTLGETLHIGRMAVLPGYRNQGIGLALLKYLIGEASTHHQSIELSAQVQAIGFYQRCGFHVCSDVYEDAGIDHVDMRCLAGDWISNRVADQQYPTLRAMDDTSWQIESPTDVLQGLDSVVSQAQQRIWLYDQTLSFALYDRALFRDLLLKLARNHRLSEVRLLIHDDQPLVQRQHQLVDLIRRLPSSVSLRLASPEYPTEPFPFMLGDREMAVWRSDFGSNKGFANFNRPGRVEQWSKAFQRMWDQGRESLELRVLSI